MPTYVITALVDTSICFGIATLLFMRARRQAWDLILLLYALAVWVSIPWATYLTPAPFQLRVIHCLLDVALWVPALVLLFALRTMGKPLTHPLLKIAIGLSAFFVATHRFSLFSSGARITSTGVTPIPGPLYIAFLIYFVVLVAYAIFAVFYMSYKAVGWQKTRLRWVGLAWVLGLTGKAIQAYLAYSGHGPISYDLFIICFASVLGYAVLTRRLYNIELVTREAACHIAAVLLAAFPLIIGWIFAPLLTKLPPLAYQPALIALLTTLAFFALAATLARYADSLPTRLLTRLFFLASLLNAALFTWVVPRSSLTVPAVRLTYFLGGWIIITWIDYRRAYFKGSEEASSSFYKIWRGCSFILLVLAATTSLVLHHLDYSQTALISFTVVPGPLHAVFYLWMFSTLTGASFWVAYRLRKTFTSSQRTEMVLMLIQVFVAYLALAAFAAFGLGKIHWPLFIILEWIVAIGVLATFVRQPQGGDRPSPRALVSVFVVTIISCFSGFMLFYGIWIRLCAGLLLTFTMPKIMNEFDGSARALVDRYLFRSKYSYLAKLRRFGDDMFRFTNLPALLGHLAETIMKDAQLVWAGIWIFDISEGRFLLRQAAGQKNTQLDSAAQFKLSVGTDDALVRCFRKDQGVVMADELSLQAEDHPSVDGSEREALEALKSMDLAAAFPLYLGTKLIGFLGFGPKTQKAAFHQEDRQTLSELGRKAEPAIGQAYMLYDQSLMFSKLVNDTLDFLHALGMNMDILRMEYLGPLNDKQQKQLMVAAHQRELIQNTLTDLSELERLMTLRLEGTWHMARLNLRRALQEALQLYEPRITAQGITVSSTLENVPEIFGEPQSIRRAIDNLLLHVIQSTSPSGSITVHLCNRDAQLVFSVMHSGDPIPDSELTHLFDPFHTPSGGSVASRVIGLELALVKEVVVLHGGRVEAVNAAGGPTFIIFLPAS